MFTLLKGIGKWFVYDWPTTDENFPLDLSQSCERRGERLTKEVFEGECSPLLIAECSRRQDARAIVKLARNGGEIRFYRTD